MCNEKLSEGAWRFENPRIQDKTRLFKSQCVVSDNLFECLGISKVKGKYYAKAREPEQTTFEFSSADNTEQSEKVNGYRKSYSRTRQDSRQTLVQRLSPWDLLFPLLQPPPLDAFADTLELPPRCEIWGYQWEGIKFLSEREGALLGDDMGTGKTVQSILAMRLLFQRGGVKSALIVCPLSVLRQWDREMERWSPSLRPTVVRGSREEREYDWEYPVHVYITTYDTLRQDMANLKEKLLEKFDLVILDEVQRIKNPGTGITKAVRGLKAGIDGGYLARLLRTT